MCGTQKREMSTVPSPTIHISENGAYLYTIDDYIKKEDADILFQQCNNLDLVVEPKVRMGIH